MFHGRSLELDQTEIKHASSNVNVDLGAASSSALAIPQLLRVVQLRHRLVPSVQHGSPVGRDDLPGHESRVVTRQKIDDIRYVLGDGLPLQEPCLNCNLG